MGIESKMKRINHNNATNEERLAAGQEFCRQLGGNVQFVKNKTSNLHILNFPVNENGKDKNFGFRILLDKNGREIKNQKIIWSMKED